MTTTKKTAQADKKTAKKVVKKTVEKKVKKETRVVIPDVKDLLEAGAHFGHVVSRWNPKMKKYIYGERNGIHVFDLFKTVEELEKAVKFLEKMAEKGKRIMLVGTKGQAVEVIKEEGERLKIPYVIKRWIGGTLTNWDEIRKRIELLVEMREKMAKGEYDKYTKKERVVLRRKIERLERLYGGLVGLTDKPEVLVVVDPVREKVAVKEAKDEGVMVVALADSNADPDFIDYVIPANDDALKTIRLVVTTLAEAIERGQKKKGVKK